MYVSFKVAEATSNQMPLCPYGWRRVGWAQVEHIWNNGPSGCASSAYFNHTIATVLANGDVEWPAGRRPGLVYARQREKDRRLALMSRMKG